MGDMGDDFKAVREQRKEDRAQYGVPCPTCVRLLPKAHPSILLPGHTCRIHGYRDRRTWPEAKAAADRRGET